MNSIARFVHVFQYGKTWHVTSGLSRFVCANEAHARALAAQLSKCLDEVNVDEPIA